MGKFKVFLALTVIFVTAALAVIPNTLQYQGKLTTPDGVGINDTLPMIFRIYTTSFGGSTIWQETHSSVIVHKGLFDVTLGETMPVSLPFDVQYWLEIVVDGSALEPRVKLTASPYAMRAKYAETTGPVTVPWGSVTGKPAGFADDIDNVNDADHSAFNECVLWFEFDDITDSLWIFDGAFPMAAYIPNGPFGFDTLYTTDSLPSDTMLVLANFRIHGELIADSIQAIGDFVNIDDSLIVHGSQWIDEDLHVTHDLYVGGNLYFSDSLFVNSIGVDTIWSEEHDVADTVVHMSQLKVYGELIADSIQAEADTIWLDDNIFVEGNAIITDSVGIGTDAPIARLHVEDEATSWGEAVGYFENTYTGSGDGAGIYAVSVPVDYYGIGVVGEGGYIGVEGDVYPTGSDYYYGVYGYVEGSDGENFGLYGDATGDGINYGVYGGAYDYGSGMSYNYGGYFDAYNGDENYGLYAEASGGSINWAGYFGDGDVNVDNDIYLNSGLNDGVDFGAHDQYLRSDGSDVFWDFLYGDLIRVDTLRTLSASDSDTIWTMAQLYVNGELIVDSIQAVGDSIEIDDNLIVHGSTVVDDDLIVYDDAMIAESLMVGMDAYVGQTVTVGTDLFVMHNAYVNDTIFANVITADSITTNYLLSTDVDILESLYVAGPANFDSTVYIDDDTLYVEGPAQFDSMVVITPGHQLWVDKIYGTVAGSLFVDTVLVTPEVALDSIEAWNGNSIIVKDSTYFREYVHIEEDLEVEGDGYFNDDVFIEENLEVGLDAYIMGELEVDLDAYFHDNLTNDDTIFANVITADSITANYLLATDVDVMESLYVDGPANFDSTVYIDDDTLYVDGPAEFDSMVVITPGHQLWVDKIYGTVAGSLFVDTVLVTPEVALDSIESWNNTSIVIKDTTYFREYVNIQEDLEVDGDGLFNQDVWIGDSLMVVGNTYLQSELEVDGDAYFHDNLTNDDTIFANVITADSITANYLLATDVDVLESLYVDGPANFDSTVVIGDDTLYVDGPAQFDSMVVITPGHQLWVDKIYGTVAGTLFVDTVLATPEVALDSLEAWNGTSIVVKDTTYFREYVNVAEDLEVDGDGLFNQDVWIGDSLMVGGNTYLAGELEVDLDAYFHDNLTNDDTIFANVITADSITANYLLATDVDVLESLYVDGPANFDSTVVIGDDTLYVDGPAEFDSSVVITSGHELWVDKIYGTVAGTLFVDTVLAVPEVALDSIEAWTGDHILIKDSLYIDADMTVTGDVDILQNLDVTGDIWGDDVYIADSLVVMGNAYIDDNLEIDHDLIVNDDAFIDDSLTVNGNAWFDNDVVIDDDLIVNDSLTVYGDGVFHADVEVGDSLFVNEYISVLGDLWVGDNCDIMDSLMIWGPIILAGGQPLWADTIYTSRIHGTKAGSLFVDTVLVVPEIALDSIEAWNGTSVLIKDDIIVDGNITVDNGNRYYGYDATGVDSYWIYDDGDTTRFDADNPIKVGDASLIVETDGDVIASQDLYVLGDADITGDLNADDIYTVDSVVVGTDLLVTEDAEIGDSLVVGTDLFVTEDAEIGDSLVVGTDAYIMGNLEVEGNALIDNGNRYYAIDASGADSLWIYDDGDTTRFDADNPIKVGDASLIVETDGDVIASQDLYVLGDADIGDDLVIAESLDVGMDVHIAGDLVVDGDIEGLEILSDGTGLAAFSYDGTAPVTVDIDLTELTLTGMTATGAAAMQVDYGILANTAVEGNQTATINAGGGLTGDMVADALGDGFTSTLVIGTTANDGITVNADDIAVNVDGATIELNADALRVMADGIDDTHVDWGAGANQVDAADLPYTPLVLTDWNGDADPGETDDGLDQLAERVDDIETGGLADLTDGTGIAPLLYDGSVADVVDIDLTELTLTGMTATGAAAMQVDYGILANTAVEGNQTATINAGGGLTGDMVADALGDGFTSTLVIGTTANDGITVNADDIAVNVDGATIELNADALRVMADGIDDTHVDWGTGANQVAGGDVPLVDAGAYYAVDDVESALQEVGLALSAGVVTDITGGVGIDPDGASSGSVTLTADLTELTLTGLSATGASAMEVDYGAIANTAVEGNQTATINAGNGLTGDMVADALGDGFTATLVVGDGTGIVVNANDVAVDLTELTLTGLTATGADAMEVDYGVAANTAVEGNQTATITASAGLTGGVTNDELGDSFTASLSVGAGNGIAVAADAVSVNVAAGEGLANNLGVGFDELGIPPDGVEDNHINWSTPSVAPAADEVSAADVPLQDAGAYFTTDNVEAALQEAAADIAQNTSDLNGNEVANYVTKWDGAGALDVTVIFDDGAGNVGINEAVPTEALDVTGNIEATGTILSGTSIIIDGTTNPGTITETNGTISFVDDNLLTTGSVTANSFSGDGSGLTSVPGDDLGDHTATQDIDMATFEVNLNGGYLSGDGDDEGIFVDAAGNVGIGTAAPAAKLAINGGLHVGGDSDPGDDNLYVDGSIRVGTPNKIWWGDGNRFLHYDGTIMVLGAPEHTTMLIDDNNNSTTSYFNIKINANTEPAATEVFRVQENGYVGVLTSSPNSMLDVNGSVSTAIAAYAAAHTADENDYTMLVSGTTTITLPDAATCAGRTYVIKNVDVNTVSIISNGGDLDGTDIDGAATYDLATQYYSVTVQSDGSDWWIISEKKTP